MKEKDINKDKVNILIDNMISIININEKSDKKQAKIIKLMPEIKKVSDLVAKDPFSFEASIFCYGFIAGADWRINSVWHDVSEKPNEEEPTIIELGNGDFSFHNRGYKFPWKYNAEYFGFKRWAYIKDLIPNTED